MVALTIRLVVVMTLLVVVVALLWPGFLNINGYDATTATVITITITTPSITGLLVRLPIT
jgi:hypothetical protein